MRSFALKKLKKMKRGIPAAMTAVILCLALSSALTCCRMDHDSAINSHGFLSVFAYPVFADDTAPLFEFDYDGRHIETYGNYSVVDGVVSSSHRFFVKDGNLVVIDQNLDPTMNGVFIHYADGKSYIAVLTKNGNIVSLGTEDLLSYLDGFTNSRITGMAQNITSNSTTLLFTYSDGSSAAYDCITGKLQYKTEPTEKQSLMDFISDGISGVFSGRFMYGFTGSSYAGAKAQQVVDSLQGGGIGLEALIDAGFAGDGWNGSSQGGNGQGWNGEGYTGEGFAEEPGGEGFGEDYEYDYAEDPAYRNLMDSKANELSEERLAAIREAFARIASGKMTPQEAINLFAFIRPGEGGDSPGTERPSEAELVEVLVDPETVEIIGVWNDEGNLEDPASGEITGIRTEQELLIDSETEEITDELTVQEVLTDPATEEIIGVLDEEDNLTDLETGEIIGMHTQADASSGELVVVSDEALSEEEKALLLKSMEEVEAHRNAEVQAAGKDKPSPKNPLSPQGKDKNGETHFVSSDDKEKYVAVYNAAEKRYDIYSQESILDNPQDPEAEAAHITDAAKAEALNSFLSDNVHSEVRRGIKLYACVAAGIALALVLIVFMKRPVRKAAD